MVTDVLCGFMQEISTHYALVLPLKITEKMLILQTKLSLLLKKIKWFKRLLWNEKPKMSRWNYKWEGCVCGGAEQGWGDCFTDKVNFSNQPPMGMHFIKK